MRIIRKGSTGQSVKLCQERLNLKGFGPLIADGIFGKNTDRVVRQFQAAHNLKVDGIVGDKTWTHLMSEEQAIAPEDVLQEEKDELRRLYKAQIHLLPANARDSVSKALEFAIEDLGKKEIPSGSNAGPEIEHLVGGYNQYWWVLEPEHKDEYYQKAKQRGYVLPEETAKPMAWCGMAVSNWMRRGLDLPDWDLKGFAKKLDGHPFERFFGGPNPAEKWAKDLGILEKAKASYKALPGTIFTMGRGGSGSDPTAATGAGHIGIVISDDGNHIITIEGNISNSIGSRRRRKTELRYFMIWW